jgi:NADH-quinone oxidoreductase subunit N
MTGVVLSAVATFTLVGDHRATFNGMFVVDSFALLFKIMFLAVAALVILVSLNYLNDNVRSRQGEFYFLLLSSFLGMLLMASSRDFIMLFVSLELVSAPGFLVAGFKKRDARSNEAAVKFFLFGVLATAVMLFGMSLIYGVAGSTNLVAIRGALAHPQHVAQPLITASILLIVVGFGFKVSAVPFHFWAPDTYEGSPVPVAAFLSVASKAAGFAGLLQLMFVAFAHQSNVWAPGFAILAVATMTLGNIVALSQTNIVRLLAYSSIAQAGYMLLPFAVVGGQGPSVMRDAFAASLTYILIYSFMNLGAFAVVIAVNRVRATNLIADYDGLMQREPGLAAAMLFFLLSLAGIPPLAGFWAKFFVFRAAINGNAAWLAAVMVVNSVIGLYYYLSIGARMVLRPAEDRGRLAVPFAIAAAIVVMVIVVVAVGVFPDFFNHFSPRSTLVAF